MPDRTVQVDVQVPSWAVLMGVLDHHGLELTIVSPGAWATMPDWRISAYDPRVQKTVVAARPGLKDALDSIVRRLHAEGYTLPHGEPT